MRLQRIAVFNHLQMIYAITTVGMSRFKSTRKGQVKRAGVDGVTGIIIIMFSMSISIYAQ